jgi:hypothetical protein
MLCVLLSIRSNPMFVENLTGTQDIRLVYWNLMEQVLADGFTFSSPNDDHINLTKYKERCWPNAYKIKKFDLVKLIVNGDDAFVTYNGWTTDGKLFRNTEYFKFKDGKIKENECFFGRGINYPNNAGN